MRTLVSALRQCRGHSVGCVAGLLGISDEQYLELEHGARDLTETEAATLARFYDLPARHFSPNDSVANYNERGGRSITNVAYYIEAK